MAWPDRLKLLLYHSLLAAAEFGRHHRACGGVRLKGLLRQASMQGSADMTVTCDPAEGNEDLPVHLCLGVMPADASGGEQHASGTCPVLLSAEACSDPLAVCHLGCLKCCAERSSRL